MASGSGTALAHRSVASIRGTSHGAVPSTPTAPSRTHSLSYGSPSTIRADDEIVVIELGSRHIRIGFAGESTPKVALRSGPEDQRRAGDFRSWQQPRQKPGQGWSEDHEYWRYDLRELDLGLYKDKLERVVRDAFTRHLLIDSRPRRIGLVLDSGVPLPLLTAVLDTMFNRFQSPTVSLMSSPVMTTVAAGLRSALVIDMGWAETVVTSIYEYREVKTTRTIRGGRTLLDALYKVIYPLIPGANDGLDRKVISFEECEDIMCRLMWCKSSSYKSPQRQSTQLETVDEQDEIEAEAGTPSGIASIPISSTARPMTIELPFEKLAEICDETLFDPSGARATFDDEDLPIHQLVYQHMLHLPIDVRAICMPRIIFTGGCSNILGIKQRTIDDVSAIIENRGWEPVFGRVVDQLRNIAKLNRKSSGSSPSDGSISPSEAGQELDKVSRGPADARPEHDPIGAKVARQRDTPQPLQGKIRVVHSLGAWTGGSLLCQLKVSAMAMIDREVWLQQGASGASRPNEIDAKVQQRQSATAGGHVRGSGQHHGNWTLGTWGSL